ncbi:hypothetical protein LJC24_05705, partial [Desulfococcaceae bacterium OttesenSCG-928-F15]|nr:hypothetical protein [Desulfococcaceae bacterium OttesenSCG-928-F15]
MTEKQKLSGRRFTLGQGLLWVWVALMVLVLGAHFFRAGEYGITICAGGLFLFLCSQSAWKRHAAAFFLFWGMLEWFYSAYSLILIRQHMGLPWLRAALILATIAVFTGLASAIASKRASSIAKEGGEASALFRGLVFIAIFLVLFYLRQADRVNFLLLERFFPLTGSAQI